VQFKSLVELEVLVVGGVGAAAIEIAEWEWTDDFSCRGQRGAAARLCEHVARLSSAPLLSRY
jgi:hypothetical protein